MSKDILILTDDIRGHSGFSVNGKLVTWALSRNWDVANVSIQAAHPATTTVHGRDLDILPGYDSPTTRKVAERGMQQAISEHEPDVVISLVDVHMCSYLGSLNRPQHAQLSLREAGKKPHPKKVMNRLQQELHKNDFNKSFEWIAQVPIDGHPMPSSWAPFFTEVDYPVAMSQYGKRVVSEQFDVDMKLIPHGVDYRSVEPVDLDEFHVGTVNRNQFRKQYPRLIEAWGKFYERAGRPDDISFYIHADFNDDEGWSLDRYIQRHDLADALYQYEGAVDREHLMRIYNRMDVFTSATAGEGFGLTTIEAMSQKTPVIITDYTTSEELVAKGHPEPRGSLVSPAVMYDENPQFSGVPRALVDTDEFADVLLAYYNDRARVREEGENAKKWVENNLGWEDVANKWCRYVERVINSTE